MTWPRWLDDLARDVRHAVRGLRRSPGHAATVVVVLALGIGASTAMFGIVHGMLLRPPPYPHGERLVRLGREPRGMPGAPVYLSAREIERVQGAAGPFEQIAAYAGFTFEWVSPDGSRPWGAPLSPALLRLLGAVPTLGRIFTDADARPGADGVVLLSHRAWVRRFGANPEVVGTVVTVNDERRTVVGVLAEGFYFPSPREEVWTPYVLSPDEWTAIVLGRLREGVSTEQAAAELRTIVETLDSSPGGPQGAGNGAMPGEAPRTFRVIPLQEEMVGAYRPALAALTAATVLVLLIACANVAGLLLARGVARRRELAVCAALGAGRGRLVRRLVTECIVLSLGGGALGLAAAVVVLRVVPALVPGNVVRLDEVGVDGVVFAFTFGLSLVVGVGCGLAPAVPWSGRDLLRSVAEGSVRAAGGFGLLRANRARAVLAAGQMALALTLLVGAGLLLRSFVALMTVDRGYDATNVVAAGTRYPIVRDGMDWHESEAARRRFQRELADAMDRLEALPQVAAVGVTSALPLAGNGSVQQTVHAVGRPAAVDPDESPPVSLRVASPGYFDALRLRLLSGRRLTRGDAAGAPRVLVVNETFARQVLGEEAAVGQRVRFAGNFSDEEPWEIVGVVADVAYRDRAATGWLAEAFAPVRQIDYAPMFSMTFPFVAVRTTGDPAAAIPFLREAVAGTRAGASVARVMTMDGRLSAAVAQPRFYAALVGSFAALAVFLAGLGVYGLLSYTVAQRRGEIGIRMALGARRGDVLALVMRQGAALAATGAVVGLAAAAAGVRVLRSFLYGIAPEDPLTFVAAPLALLVVALLACYLPARRATRIAPMDVLRSE
ncbi:MAG: ABC transporter permease [Acidobacteria bacterium]|nr:ABC transporter permease [Acidobacteriota bacterium]